MRVETVAVVRADSPRGFRIIAKSDFDPSIHELYEPAAEDPDGDPEGGEGSGGDPDAGSGGDPEGGQDPDGDPEG